MQSDVPNRFVVTLKQPKSVSVKKLETAFKGILERSTQPDGCSNKGQSPGKQTNNLIIRYFTSGEVKAPWVEEDQGKVWINFGS